MAYITLFIQEVKHLFSTFFPNYFDHHLNHLAVFQGAYCALELSNSTVRPVCRDNGANYRELRKLHKCFFTFLVQLLQSTAKASVIRFCLQSYPQPLKSLKFNAQYAIVCVTIIAINSHRFYLSALRLWEIVGNFTCDNLNSTPEVCESARKFV